MTQGTQPDGAPPGQPWGVTGSLVWAVAVSLVLLSVGALAGRPDVALLGVAPLLASLSATWLRPRGQVWADSAQSETTAGVLAQRVQLSAPPGCTAVRLRLGRPEHGFSEALVHVPLHREIEVTARSVRTGPQQLFRVEHQGIGSGGLTAGPVGEEAPDAVVVLPRSRTMPALPLPSRMRGLTGQHESRRPGQGGGLRDVHLFLPGDSIRQVDWKVTARRSPNLEQLYVRRTMALGEAVVVLVVDSRDDATSLDLARQAAMTVAEGYLAVGDRVAVEDLGVRRRGLRPGTGHRQLDRVVQQLALLRPEGDPRQRIRPPRVSAGSLVYVFSTFLDAEAADMARAWRRMGQGVIAVDVLPNVRTRGLDARHWLAIRLIRIEREDRLAELAAAGVEVLRWPDAAGTTERLQLASRRSRRRPGRSMAGAVHR